MPTDELLGNLPHIVAAIGGLGTAAFGLVDASKIFWGGVNHVGFAAIRETFATLTPGATSKDGAPNTLSQQKMLDTLRANWFNGTDLSSQKAIAKSFVRLALSANSAPDLAQVTGIDREMLSSVATGVASGTSLSAPQSDTLGRFDLIVTALLDEAYQRGDHAFRNATRGLAMFIAIVLAIAGAWIISQSGGTNLDVPRFAEAVLVGLLATPLAPIAKDLSTALATAVNTMQSIKK